MTRHYVLNAAAIRHLRDLRRRFGMTPRREPQSQQTQAVFSGNASVTVHVTSVASGTVYNGYIVLRNASTWTAFGNVYIEDGGSAALTAGNVYPAIMMGARTIGSTTKPLCVCSAGGGSSGITVAGGASGDLTGIDTLRFDSTYFDVTNPSTGEADVSLKTLDTITIEETTNHNRSIWQVYGSGDGSASLQFFGADSSTTTAYFLPYSATNTQPRLQLSATSSTGTKNAYYSVVDVNNNEYIGAYGTDGINTFKGGLCTSIGTSSGASGTDPDSGIFSNGICTTISTLSGVNTTWTVAAGDSVVITNGRIQSITSSGS